MPGPGTSVATDLSQGQMPALQSSLLVEDEKSNVALWGLKYVLPSKLEGVKSASLRNSSVNDFLHSPEKILEINLTFLIVC